MKRRTGLVLLLSILSLTLVACTTAGAEEKLKVEDVERVLTESIKEYLAKDGVYQLEKLEFKEDKLALDDRVQMKKLNNIDMTIELGLKEEKDPIDYKEDDEAGNEAKFTNYVTASTEKLLNYLKDENQDEFFNINRVKTVYKDKKEGYTWKETRALLRDQKTVKALIETEFKEENEVLEKLFKQVDLDRVHTEDFSFTRFGKEGETLIVEFDLHKKIAKEENLKGFAGKLHKIIDGNKNFQADLRGQKISQIKIIFNKDYDEKNPLIFKYSVE